MPDPGASGTGAPEFDRLAVGFARLLRGAGLDVPVGATLVFAEALAAVGISTAGRGVLGRAHHAGAPSRRRRALRPRRSRRGGRRVREVSFTAPSVQEIVLAFDTDHDDDTGDDDGEAREAPDAGGALQPGRGAASPRLRALQPRRVRRVAPVDGRPAAWPAPCAGRGGCAPAVATAVVPISGGRSAAPSGPGANRSPAPTWNPPTARAVWCSCAT